MKIGTLARCSGLSAETIRYYERLGLLDEPPRTPGGVRKYPESALRQLRTIRRAQALGFSLSEIGELLQLYRCGTDVCSEVRDKAGSKLEEVEREIERLTTIRDELRRLMCGCSATEPGGACPMFGDLETTPIELLYERGCHYLERIRDTLINVCAAAGFECRWQEWELGAVDLPSHLEGHQAPAVLVNRSDVMPLAVTAEGALCRLYPHDDGSLHPVPHHDTLLAALRRIIP